MPQSHFIFRMNQKLLYALFSLAIFSFQFSFCQRIVNSTGSTIHDNSIYIEYSIGEFAITTLTANGSYTTQGLLQPIAKLDNPDCMVINDTISYFPNPTEDILRIVSRQNWISAYRIYASDGRLVRAAPFFNNQINLHSLPGGVYFIKLYPGCNDKFRTLKVVKQ